MTPSLAELLSSLRVVSLPLAAPFRGVSVREVALFEGPGGWAEFAPFRDHDDQHSANWLAAAIEQAYGEWPVAVRSEIPVNAIVPDVAPAEISRWANSAMATGISCFKLKVATGLPDVERVAALREAIGDGAIRLDVNGRWDLAQALSDLPPLLQVAGWVEYVEQPVRELSELVQLRQRLEIKVAVDEAIRLDRQVDRLADFADVAVVKAIPLGGVQAAIKVAQAVDLPVVVSGSLDTAVGLASGLQLAAALPTLPYACGLATSTLFAEDVVLEKPTVVNGAIAIGRRVPDESQLLKFAATDETQQYWRDRLSRCYRILESK